MRAFLSIIFYLTLIGSASSQYFPPTDPLTNVANISYDDKNKNRPLRYFLSIFIEYKFNVISSSPIGTRFVATQFWLDPWNGRGGGDTLYMGINPTQRTQDYPGQAHFSYFGTQAGTLYSSNCSRGADGGPGVSCGVTLPTQEKHKYRLSANITDVNNQHTIVKGILDEWDETGKFVQSVVIGEFEILRGNMGFSYPQGWVEGSSDPCSELVKTEIELSAISVQNFDSKYGKYNIPIKTIPSNKCGVTLLNYPDENTWIIKYGEK